MSVERPVQNMEEFDYELPKRAIGQYPADPRDSAKLLIDRGTVRGPEHLTVADLPEQLDPGDLVVLNETRVIPARLPLRKVSGGAVEVLLLEPVIEGWAALVRPGRRVKNGTELRSERDRHLRVIVGEKIGDGGERKVEVVHDGKSVTGPLDCDRLSLAGEPPLPPYIVSTGHSPDRYQTVYAREPGAIAAPTAGLHLTDALLDELRAVGVEVAEVVLHVGAGTFRPLDADTLARGRLHAERFVLPEETVRAVERTRRTGGRVVAVGTTTARVLESGVDADGALAPGEGETELFLRPGGPPLRVIDGLLTNFHLPRSSLLLLVATLVGRAPLLEAYAHAIRSGYRFYSYGDACLLYPRRAG